MINNDILRRIGTILDLTPETTLSTFKLGQCEVTEQQLNDFFKEKNDADYQPVEDRQLASFLNGLIVAKRGLNGGKERPAEHTLTNNMIFNKIKIALSLQAEDVINALELAGFTVSKYELSAFFRNVNHKHYKDCSDDVLSAFLKGLKSQVQENI